MLREGSGDQTAKVEVFARGTVDIDGKSDKVDGKDTLTLGKLGTVRFIELQVRTVIAIPLIFLASILLAVWQSPSRPLPLKIKYYWSIVLTFAFTFTMIIYILIGLYQINLVGSPGEILTLGFLHFNYGTYVKDVNPEWLVSLTSEATNLQANGGIPSVVPRGFGAPLWVLLMSVIGAASFTIVIIVRQIGEPVEFNPGSNVPADVKEPRAKVRERVEQMVVHQVYILIAPLGAIIVYQTLVLAEAASQHITVATLALASGLAVNVVLDKSRKSVENLLRGIGERSPEDEQRKRDETGRGGGQSGS